MRLPSLTRDIFPIFHRFLFAYKCSTTYFYFKPHIFIAGQRFAFDQTSRYQYLDAMTNGKYILVLAAKPNDIVKQIV